MKTKKFAAALLAIAVAGTVSVGFTACGKGGNDGNVGGDGTHTAVSIDAKKTRIIVMGYEWGPAIPKIIVELNGDVSGVSKDTFSVSMGSGFSKSKRTVTDAYACDAEGNKVTTATKYIAIEMSVKYGEASPFNYNQQSARNEWNDSLPVTVKVNSGKRFKAGTKEYLDGDKFEYTVTASDRLVPQTATWNKDSYKYEGEGKDITLSRASWTPAEAKTDGGKNPLVIWLHGGGEGGTDIDIALLGNEVTALTADNATNVQSYFTTSTIKGAYVLAVQSPTMWMDEDGEGHYGNSAANGEATGQPQVSYYTEALWGAITDYVSHNSDIDTDRIYIGGCSNGGYMTVNLALEHGDYFAAYYPICQGYLNGNISDDMLAKLKDLNMWFLLSEDDTTLSPEKYTIPLYYRLLQAGAENVHLTYKKNVPGVDDPNPSSWGGQAGCYMGHWSWICAFNDDVKKEIDNSKVTSQSYLTPENCTKDGNMWQWLASQTIDGQDVPPPASGSVETYTFEAENGVLAGSRHVQVNEWYGYDTVAVETKTLYTGNETTGAPVSAIGYFSGEDASITWTITAEEECDVTLTLWAASSVTKTEKQLVDTWWGGKEEQDVVVGIQPVEFTNASQPVTLKVNNGNVTLLGTVTGLDSITPTAMKDYSYYANYVGTVTATIHLNAGANTVVLKAPAENPQINIDKIVISGTTVKLSYVPVNNIKG